MNSVILQIAAKYVRWLLVFFAIVALYRGHNHPGGGFIGGLLVALSVIFYSLAFNAKKAKEKLMLQPESNIALGLILILISVLPGLFQKQFFNGRSMDKYYRFPVLGELKLGTPFLFDIGVFFAVIGVTLMFFFSLKQNWKMEIILAILVGVLYTAGVYMVLRRSILKFIIGLIFLSNATNLLVFISSGIVAGEPAFVGEGTRQYQVLCPIPCHKLWYLQQL